MAVFLVTGKTPEERARIIAGTAAAGPLLRSSATVVIDARRPLAEVVDQLAVLAGPPHQVPRRMPGWLAD